MFKKQDEYNHNAASFNFDPQIKPTMLGVPRKELHTMKASPRMMAGTTPRGAAEDAAASVDTTPVHKQEPV